MDVPLILFHRLFVPNSEMWIEEHQARHVIICFYPLLNIKLSGYCLVTRTRVALSPGASPDDQNKKKTFFDVWQNVASFAVR